MILKHVKQKHKTGCGIACAAMICGIKYVEAFKIMYPQRKKKYYTSEEHFEKIFTQFGLKITTILNKDFLELQNISILVLKSTISEKRHAIVWDPNNRMLFDPSRKDAITIKNIHEKFYNDYIQERIIGRYEVCSIS